MKAPRISHPHSHHRSPFAAAAPAVLPAVVPAALRGANGRGYGAADFVPAPASEDVGPPSPDYRLAAAACRSCTMPTAAAIDPCDIRLSSCAALVLAAVFGNRLILL